MKIFVISDNFRDAAASSEIHHATWDSYRPRSLGGYRCVLVDMTFSDSINRRLGTLRTLHDLAVRFGAKDYLSNHDLIIVVICGALNEDLELEEDIPGDSSD